MIIPKYIKEFVPEHPCRLIESRHCPAIYDKVCEGLCARYESKDPTPWLPEEVNISICSEYADRNNLTEEEFWAHVYQTEYSDYSDEPDLDTLKDALDEPCPVCRSTGACGYDSEGRPMIHTVEDDD